MVIEFQEKQDEIVELNNPALQIYLSIALISLLPLIFVFHFKNIFRYNVLSLDISSKRKLKRLHILKPTALMLFVETNILESFNHRFPETIVEINFVSLFAYIKLYSRICFSAGFPSTVSRA